MLKVKIHTDHDIVLVSHLTAGLFNLESRKEIITQWRMPFTISRKISIPAVIRLEVTLPDGIIIRHCFDLHDVRSCWDWSALQWTDIYWKSNYHQSEVSKLEERLRTKVRRYGLYYPVRSLHDRLIDWRLLGSARARISYQRHKFHNLKPWHFYSQTILRKRSYFRRLTEKQYANNDYNRPVDIYFHPGCWPMTDQIYARANYKRRDIIVKMKKEFRERFVGGFTDNPHARAHFPSEIYPFNRNHDEYVRALQQAHIVVSTNGLDSCHSWRTGEALAAGAILVTERPVNEIDDYLTDQKNVFFYDSPDDCVDICRSILSLDSASLLQLHHTSQAYYEHNLAPGSNLLSRLTSK